MTAASKLAGKRNGTAGEMELNQKKKRETHAKDDGTQNACLQASSLAYLSPSAAGKPRRGRSRRCKGERKQLPLFRTLHTAKTQSNRHATDARAHAQQHAPLRPSCQSCRGVGGTCRPSGTSQGSRCRAAWRPRPTRRKRSRRRGPGKTATAGGENREREEQQATNNNKKSQREVRKSCATRHDSVWQKE